MARPYAIGNSPILFTDADGKQTAIPLSALQFDGPTIKPDSWPPFSTLSSDRKRAVQDWLDRLVQSGVLTASPAPPPTPALVLTAQDPGAAGNNIQVVFRNVVPDVGVPANTTVDMDAMKTDTYSGLTPDTIGEVLGVDATPGKRPGLVQVKGAGPYALPKNGNYTLSGGNGGKASTDVSKKSGSGVAFTLEAKRDGVDGNSIQISIQDVDAVQQTFTLIASWKKSASGIKLANITTNFGFIVAADPPNGGAFAPPNAGTFALSGGSDAAAATSATVVAIAG